MFGRRDSVIRLRAWVHGHVQGVGFRWATRKVALEHGLVGYAKNYPDGRVLVIAEGTKSQVKKLETWLREGDTPGTVRFVATEYTSPKGTYDGFDRK